MKTIEEYAIELVADGAESVAEDDLNEDNAVSDMDHGPACDLAIEIARAIKENPAVVLALVGRGPLAGAPDAADLVDAPRPTDEPPNGTVLADLHLSEAWQRDDKAATGGGYGNQHWYPFSGIDDQCSWDELPEYIRNGTRLVVAEPASEMSR